MYIYIYTHTHLYMYAPAPECSGQLRGMFTRSICCLRLHLPSNALGPLATAPEPIADTSVGPALPPGGPPCGGARSCCWLTGRELSEREFAETGSRDPTAPTGPTGPPTALREPSTCEEGG